jgi:flavorubredoxin
METRVDEIADGIYRLSTLIPEVAPPRGFTFNQFVIDAQQPVLYHCGPRPMFESVLQAFGRIMDPARLRWILYSHAEGDECGALNDWLAAAPDATVAHGALGCALWLNDMADRPPRGLGDDERIDIGGKRLRYLDTPHVPHNVDAGLLFEETTGTLFCSDLFAHVGDGPAVTESDLLDAAIEADRLFPFTPVTPITGPTLRRLADLSPRTLAIMHGASFRGDGGRLLEGLAGYYEQRLAASVTA